MCQGLPLVRMVTLLRTHPEFPTQPSARNQPPFPAASSSASNPNSSAVAIRSEAGSAAGATSRFSMRSQPAAVRYSPSRKGCVGSGPRNRRSARSSVNCWPRSALAGASFREGNNCVMAGVNVTSFARSSASDSGTRSRWRRKRFFNWRPVTASDSPVRAAGSPEPNPASAPFDVTQATPRQLVVGAASHNNWSDGGGVSGFSITVAVVLEICRSAPNSTTSNASPGSGASTSGNFSRTVSLAGRSLTSARSSSRSNRTTPSTSAVCPPDQLASSLSPRRSGASAVTNRSSSRIAPVACETTVPSASRMST